MDWLTFGDYFFFLFHLLFILFILFGWMVYSLRRWHLAAILLTFFSWFVLGIWMGWGYCPLTDWHWQILRRTGQWDLHHSYVAYILERTTKLSLSDGWADAITVGLAVASLFLSVKVNFYSKTRKT